MQIKNYLTTLCCAFTMLSIDFNELLSETSAVEQGGAAYGLIQTIKKIGGAGVVIILLICLFVGIACAAKYFGGIVVNLNNPAKLQETKGNIGWLIVGLVGMAFADGNGKEVTMGSMNFNEISGRFDGKRSAGNYNNAAFHSMPLMNQARRKKDLEEDEREYQTRGKTYQQPMLAQRESANFDNQQYSSPSYEYGFEEEEMRKIDKSPHKKSIKVVFAGCATLAALCVILTIIVCVSTLLKNRPVVIAKEQVIVEEQTEAESISELPITDFSGSEKNISETITSTESDSENSIEEAANMNNEEETTAAENTEPVFWDITSIISDGSIVNQVVVENIMMQYEDVYNFVVYGLPDETTENEPLETASETGTETTEAVVEKEMKEKYYKVSLEKPGSITFTEIAFQ